MSKISILDNIEIAARRNRECRYQVDKAYKDISRDDYALRQFYLELVMPRGTSHLAARLTIFELLAKLNRLVLPPGVISWRCRNCGHDCQDVAIFPVRCKCCQWAVFSWSDYDEAQLNGKVK